MKIYAQADPYYYIGEEVFCIRLEDKYNDFYSSGFWWRIINDRDYGKPTSRKIEYIELTTQQYGEYSKTSYLYFFKESSYGIKEQDLFTTFEAAQAECDKRNEKL